MLKRKGSCQEQQVQFGWCSKEGRERDTKVVLCEWLGKGCSEDRNLSPVMESVTILHGRCPPAMEAVAVHSLIHGNRMLIGWGLFFICEILDEEVSFDQSID